MTDCKDDAKGAVSIPKSYKGKPVTKIGDNAFQYCGNITSIVIPATVTAIGYSAFSQIHSVKSITIPDSVKSIGNYAFSHNNKLSSIKIGKGITAIPKAAFKNCYSLTTVTIPGNVKTIGEMAFADCSLLETVKINKGVTSIGNYAFYMNSSLKTVILPEGLTSVGEQAFYGTQKLNSIVIPGSVKTLSKKSFGYVVYDKSDAEFKIFGKKGSATEKYAKNNGIKFGDVTKLSLSTPTVKRINNKNGVKVTWNKVANAQSYIVYKSVYNASTKKWSKWSTLKSYVAKTEFVDKNVTLGTIYRYTVKAVNGTITGKYKASDAIRYNVTPAVVYKNTSNGVLVLWTTVANATGYTVYSSSYNTKTKKWSSWSNRGTAKGNKTEWVDKKAKSGNRYRYTVRAVYGSFRSKYNTQPTGLLYLAAPTVKVNNTTTGVKVTWNKTAGAKSYNVYRRTSDTSWKKLATTSSSVVSYTDKTANNGAQYLYTVKAVNEGNSSAYISSSALKYLSVPKVSVSAVANGIEISWNTNMYADSYRVYKSTFNEKKSVWNSRVVCADISDSTVSSYIDESAEQGEKYRYTVKALSGKYSSAYISSEAVSKENVSEELSSENVKDIFTPLICNYHSLDELGHAYYYEDRTNYIELLTDEWYEENDPERYTSHLFKLKDIKSIAELKNMYKKYLSEDLVEKYTFNEKYFITVDSELYIVYNNAVGTCSYDIDSIELSEKNDDEYLVEIDLYNSGDMYCETQSFSVKKSGNSYVIDRYVSSDYEKRDYDYENPNYDPDTNYFVY